MRAFIQGIVKVCIPNTLTEKLNRCYLLVVTAFHIIGHKSEKRIQRIYIWAGTVKVASVTLSQLKRMFRLRKLRTLPFLSCLGFSQWGQIYPRVSFTERFRNEADACMNIYTPDLIWTDQVTMQVTHWFYWDHLPIHNFRLNANHVINIHVRIFCTER